MESKEEYSLSRFGEILLIIIALDASDDLTQDLADRGVDAELFSVFGDFAVEDVDLGLTLVEQHILRHGWVIVSDIGDYILMIMSNELVSVHGDTLCGCNCTSLADDAVEQPLTERISLDLADLQAQNCADGIDGRIDADFLPDELIDVVVCTGLTIAPTGIAAADMVVLEKLCACCVVELAADSAAEVHLNTAGGSGYTGTGLGHRSAEDAGTDYTALFGEYLEEVVVVAEAVDERNSDGGLAHNGHGVIDCLYKLCGLGHIDDNIDFALCFECRRCAGVCTEAIKDLDDIVILAVLFLMDSELHAAFCDFLHVCLIAVYENDVSAAIAEVGSENAACCAGAVHCYFHI